MESQGPETGPSLTTPEPSPTPRATNRALSSTRLARMHDALLRHVNSGRLPGLVALISRRSAEHCGRYRVPSVRPYRAIQRDTISASSVTKRSRGAA